mmetsp:Transcript_22483/g.58632  ORF Transcript_22483/g.58632 Transcript_22483/m.58632 type:complete len:297 (-) Transcript_22483:32-922(-)
MLKPAPCQLEKKSPISHASQEVADVLQASAQQAHRSERRVQNAGLGAGVLRHADVLLARRHLCGDKATQLLLGVLVAQGGHHHALVAVGPVGGGGHAVHSRELQGVDHAQDLVKVAPRGGGVQQRELELLVGADDEHRAGSHGQPGGILLIRINHAKLHGQFPLGVAHNGVIHLGPMRILGGLDILDPALVGLGIIAGQRRELDTPAFELRLVGRDGSQLRGAHRSVVRGVAEEDCPGSIDVFVPLDGALRAVRREVGEHVSEIDAHIIKVLGGVVRRFVCWWWVVRVEQSVGRYE